MTPPPRVLCGTQCETPEAAERNFIPSGPEHGISQRRRVDSDCSFDLQRRLRACRAIERDLKRCRRQPQFNSGMFARKRREKIAQGQAGVDRFAAPHKMAVRTKTAGNRWPRDLEFHVAETVDKALIDVVDNDNAVADPDLRECRSAIRIGRQSMRQGVDQTRPIGSAAGLKSYRDRRPHQRHVGDFNASGEQWKIAQPRGQFVRHNRRFAGAVVAKYDVMEAHSSGWEQRNLEITAQHRIETGDRVNFLRHGITHRRGRHQERQRNQRDECHHDHGGNANRNAFQAGSRDQGVFRCCLGRPILPGGRAAANLITICVAFVAGGLRLYRNYRI